MVSFPAIHFISFAMSTVSEPGASWARWYKVRCGVKTLCGYSTLYYIKLVEEYRSMLLSNSNISISVYHDSLLNISIYIAGHFSHAKICKPTFSTYRVHPYLWLQNISSHIPHKIKSSQMDPDYYTRSQVHPCEHGCFPERDGSDRLDARIPRPRYPSRFPSSSRSTRSFYLEQQEMIRRAMRAGQEACNRQIAQMQGTCFTGLNQSNILNNF